MTDSPTLEVPDAPSPSDDPGVVPPPLPPDDPEAWYAPAVVNLVTQLAAADGTELNTLTLSAKVNLGPTGVDATIRCALALPIVSENRQR